MLPELSSNWQIAVFVFVIFEWCLRIFMLFVVPRNRHPSSALTWLLLIMVIPFFGTLLYVLFGNPKLPRVRQHAQFRADSRTNRTIQELVKNQPSLIGTPRSATQRGLATLSRSLGGLPVFSGNEITFVTDYAETLDEQARAIDTARDYVHLEYFILVLDDETEKIFTALERAVKRGVKVRVLYDRFATKRYPNYRKTLERLTSIGADWHPMLPYNLMPGKNYTRFDLRNHRKILVIDGEMAYIASSNIIKQDYHRKDGLIYEDMLIKLTGPIVWQCNTVFRADWYAETHETLSDIIDHPKKLEKTGDVSIQVLPSGPSHAFENNLVMYTSLFHTAQQRISIVVPYFVPDEAVITALTSAAKRGVSVTLINSEIIDKTFTGHAQRSYYNELLSAGVKVYLHKKPIFLHNKQVLIDDDVAAIGSSNLDTRSFELSLEITLLVYDKKIVRQLDEIEDTYLASTKRITQASWQARPLRLKLLDTIARLTSLLQ
jgi:cardiolipin synthase